MAVRSPNDSRQPSRVGSLAGNPLVNIFMSPGIILAFMLGICAGRIIQAITFYKKPR